MKSIQQYQRPLTILACILGSFFIPFFFYLIAGAFFIGYMIYFCIHHQLRFTPYLRDMIVVGVIFLLGILSYLIPVIGFFVRFGLSCVLGFILLPYVQKKVRSHD